jgi:hypothetical protein
MNINNRLIFYDAAIMWLFIKYIVLHATCSYYVRFEKQNKIYDLNMALQKNVQLSTSSLWTAMNINNRLIFYDGQGRGCLTVFFFLT